MPPKKKAKTTTTQPPKKKAKGKNTAQPRKKEEAQSREPFLSGYLGEILGHICVSQNINSTRRFSFFRGFSVLNTRIHQPIIKYE